MLCLKEEDLWFLNQMPTSIIPFKFMLCFYTRGIFFMSVLSVCLHVCLRWKLQAEERSGKNSVNTKEVAPHIKKNPPKKTDKSQLTKQTDYWNAQGEKLFFSFQFKFWNSTWNFLTILIQKIVRLKEYINKEFFPIPYHNHSICCHIKNK